MNCPFCNHSGTRVLHSRVATDGACVRRRRECDKCGKRFWTFERCEMFPLLVVKKGGCREDFDGEKLLSGVLKACQKRPVSYRAAKDMVMEIERDLRSSGKAEVSSETIGEMVMEGLRSLDEVAYVRFASVYKEFKDVSSFTEELLTLQELRQRFSTEEKQ